MEKDSNDPLGVKPKGESKILLDALDIHKKLTIDQKLTLTKMKTALEQKDKGRVDVFFFLVVNIVREKPEKIKEVTDLFIWAANKVEDLYRERAFINVIEKAYEFTYKNLIDKAEFEKTSPWAFLGSALDGLSEIKVLEEQGKKEWTGRDEFKYLEKAGGMKESMEIYEQIFHGVPLSLRGFGRVEKPNAVVYQRQVGDRTIELTVTGELVPAAGDLAKRTVHSYVRFAEWRKTDAPGPIEFGEVLKLMGEETASEATRKNIKDYSKAFAKTAIEIKEKDRRGKEKKWVYAPLFKTFIWDGGHEKTAKIYPVFNEEFRKAYQNFTQYVYILDERLRPLPKGMTDRDRLFQDYLRLLLGLRFHKVKVINLLHKLQMGDDELYKRSQEQIKKFLHDDLERAKNEWGLIRKYILPERDTKKDFLNANIVICPAKPGPPKIRINKSEADELLEEILKWAYDPDRKLYVKQDYDKTREELKNVIYAYGPEKIRPIFEEYHFSQEGGSEWSDGQELGVSGVSNYMLFWEDIKALNPANSPLRTYPLPQNKK